MKKANPLSLLLSAFALAVTSASAATVATFDFESEVPGWFSFAQNGGNIATIQIIPGAGGTDGISTRITAAPGSFAGGGIGGNAGPLDLAIVGVTAGNFTTVQFDNIRVTFDINLPVGQSINVRLEPGNAGFNERVDLGSTINGTGAFQSVSLNASLGLAAQKTTFVNTMNTAVPATGVTGIKFVFGINNQSAVPFPTDFIFDNLNVSYVPEPSSAIVLTLVGMMGLARRRRCS